MKESDEEVFSIFIYSKPVKQGSGGWRTSRMAARRVGVRLSPRSMMGRRLETRHTMAS
jgi:hypothetical protein